MNTLGDLRAAVKRFVYNNTNAAAAYQGQVAGPTFEELIDAAFLSAANNARKYAEGNASFSALEITVPAFFPKGMGINLERLYPTDGEFEVSTATKQKRVVGLKLTGTLTDGADAVVFPGLLPTEIGVVVWTPTGLPLTLVGTEYLASGYVWTLRKLVDSVPVAEWTSTSTATSPDLIPTGAWHPIYNEHAWKPTSPATGTPVTVTEEVLTDVVPALFRYDGKGVLYIGINENLTDFWGDSAERLKSFALTQAPTGDTVDAQFLKEFTVWTVMDDFTLDGDTFKTYRVGYRNEEITRPTAWQELNVLVGPGYFGDFFRLNTVTFLNYLAENGGTNPITITTKRSENANRMDQVVDYPCDCFIRATLENRLLSLNVETTEDIPVEISGYRWMDNYTEDTATDFLLEDGFAFMQWQTILELNYIVQIYVARNEGSLPPPEKARNEAWAALMVNDAFANSSFHLPA